MEPIATTNSQSAALEHQQQQAIRCKLAFNGDLRCCMLALPASWDNLRADVARLFNLDQPFTLKYVDTEGDSVSFDSASELQDAITQAISTEDKYLRLSVHLPSTAAMEVAHHHHHQEQAGRGKRGTTKTKVKLGAAEMEALLDQLEARGLGQHKKRGATLLRKMGGDIDAVTNLLKEVEATREARRQARQQKKLGRASSLGVEDPRKAAREERKKERMAKKQLQKAAQDGLVSLQEGWPAGVDGLYLDGNNMLFLSAALRKHALGRGQRWIAEDMLSSIAESFARAKEADGLRTTIMIYDSIAKNRCGTKALTDTGAHFSVASARPEFTTSDDAMVAWAQALSPAKAKTSLFVTSDRELQRRLHEAGALVAKPKQWLALAKRTVEGDHKKQVDVPQLTMSEEEAQPEQGSPQAARDDDDDSGLDAFLEEWGKKMILSDDTDQV